MRKENHVTSLSLNVCPQLGKSTTSPQRQPAGQVAIGTLVLSLQWYKEVISRLILNLLEADNKDSADALKKKEKQQQKRERHIEYSILKKENTIYKWEQLYVQVLR